MDLHYEQTESRRTDNTLAGGGEMGRLMREQDWAASPLGDMSHWPQSLRTAVSICLTSRFPIILFWGPEHLQFYNDAYRPMLGTSKHPQALGQRAQDCWPEIWDVIGPMLQGVLLTSEATWSENQLLLLDRNGYVEEAYFTFSYSPIRDESGEVGGVFCAVTETTNAVLGTRRLATLRALATNTAQEYSAEDVCRAAATTLADNVADLPFALLYLLDSASSAVSLTAHVGLSSEVLANQAVIALTDPSAPWPFAQIAATGKPVMLALADVAGLTWHDDVVPTIVFVLPIVSVGEPYGFLVAGINPRHRLDDEYRGFLSLVAGQIATAIASARTLQDARERANALAELDRAKTTFFSNVSHEFRTPLTLLLGPLETLLMDTEQPLTEVQRSQVQMVHRNGLRQLKLVNTLLDFSRIEAGRVEAVYEPMDLARITIDLTSAFRSAIEQAGLCLVVQVAPLPEEVYVDRDMWEKIVLNLLSNALKFTLQGEIRVYLRAEGDTVQLSVEDTGVGIDPQDLPHLFERFYRAHRVQARTYEGSGIGLALVQELVRMHRGTIAVTSQLGSGSTFTVTIPRGKAHLPADRLGSSHLLPSTAIGAEPYVEEALHWLPEPVQVEEDGHIAPLPISKPATILLSGAVSSSAAACILVVDDNADMRDHLRRLLRPTYTVRTVSDGAAALEIARSWLPDLILTDVMMPGLGGFELLAALRADARTRFIPVIVLSARAGEEAVVEGLQSGAVDYLVKPFSTREALARVQAQLEIARLQRESINRARTLEAIFEAIVDPLFIVDTAKNVRGMNRAALDLLGIPSSEQPSSDEPQVYRHLFELYDERGRLLPEDEWPQAAMFRGAILQGATAVDVQVRTADGRALFLSVTGMPIYAETGEISAAIMVCRDVTARKRIEEALREVNRQTDDFIGIVSHELKSPLTTIKGNVQLARRQMKRLLAQNIVWPEETASTLALVLRFLERAEHHVLVQTRLINDLLDASRIHSNLLELHIERCDLVPIVREAVEDQHHLAEKRTIQLTLEQAVVPIMADADRVGQVLNNFLSNALKYSDEDKPVEVRLYDIKGQQVRVEVVDEGPGLSHAQQERIWERFYRVPEVEVKSGSGVGLGLGLHICRTIIERQGGQVGVESVPGQGSTFWFTLPITDLVSDKESL